MGICLDIYTHTGTCTLSYYYLDKQHRTEFFTVSMHVGYHNECHDLNRFVHHYANTATHPHREHNIFLNLPALKILEDYRLYRRASSRQHTILHIDILYGEIETNYKALNPCENN